MRLSMLAFAFCCASSLCAQDTKDEPLPFQATARLGTSLFRLGYDARALAISPDGKYLAVDSFDAVAVFEPNTGRLIRHWTHRHPTAIAFSPDSQKLLLASSGDMGSIIIDLATWKEQVFLPAKMFARKAAFSPDRRRLAFVGPEEKKLLIWDIENEKSLAKHDIAGDVWHLHWSRDGQSIGMSLRHTPVGPLETFLAIDAMTGKEKQKLTLAKPGWGDFAFSPTEDLIALCPSWGEIRLVSEKDVRQVEAKKEHTAHLGHVAFSPDGKLLVSSDTGGGLSIWDVATGKKIRSMKANPTARSHLVFAPDGKRFYSAGDQGVVRAWDTATGEPLDASDAPRAGVSRFTLTPDAKSLLTSYRDYTSRIWSLEKGSSTTYPHKEPSFERVCGFTSDGKGLLWSTGFHVYLSDLATGKRLVQYGMEPAHHGRYLDKAGFGKDAKTVIAAGDGYAVYIFDGERDKVQREIKGVYGPLKSLSVSPDGSMAFFGEGTGNVCLLDLDKGSIRWRVKLENWGPAANFTLFSPDNRWVIARSSNASLVLYDTATGKHGPRFAEHCLGVRAAFSPDSRMIAVDDNTTNAGSSVRVWEVLTGKLRVEFKGHRGAVNDIAFTPDGSSLISGGADTSILVWDLTGKLRFAGKKEFTKKDLEDSWRLLGDDDASKAFETVQRLSLSGDAVPFLRDRLRPIDGEYVRKRIAGLADDLEDFRREAQAELIEIGDAARPFLEEAFKKDYPSREAAKEIPELLKRLSMNASFPQTAATRRLVRAIEVLERINSDESRKVLRSLTTGLDTLVAREANLSLRRIEKSP